MTPRPPIAALLAALALLPACGPGAEESGDGPGTTTSAASARITLEPPPAGSRARLVRVLDVSASVPVRATLTLDDGQGHVRTVHPPHSATAFTTGIPGFRPERDYTVTVTLEDDEHGGEVASEVFSFSTEALPSPAPELELHTDLGDPERGDTLFPVRTEAGGGYLLMVDAEGELIFALDGGGTWWRTARLLDDGKLMLIADHQVLVTDWADLAPVAFDPPAGTEGYHHEAIPRPGGGFFAFTAGPTPVDDFPPSYDAACDPGVPVTIWDSIVVEADSDGSIVQTWSLAERLDTHRIGWNSLDQAPTGPDWGHANGMDYLPEDDAFVISMRNQDLVLKLSRQTGEVEWILSNPWGWDPAFEALRLQPTDASPRWNFHQHAPEWVDGRLLIHDNGAENDMPCGPAGTQPKTTRAVEFTIDEASGTFTESWAWEGPLFSPIMGDADRVEGDRVLITYGQTDRNEDGVLHSNRSRGTLAGRMIEVDRATGTIHWDLEVYEADRPDNPGGFKVPRSQRISSWWPEETDP